MKHFCNSQLANILEGSLSTSENVNKQEQTQAQHDKHIKKLKRSRTKVKTREYVPITSSDRHKAFWINEWRITHPEKYVEKPRKKIAYYKVFGKEIIIDDKEINVFIEHNVTIYYK